VIDVVITWGICYQTRRQEIRKMKIILNKQTALTMVVLLMFSSDGLAYAQENLKKTTRADEKNTVSILKKRPKASSRISQSPLLINRLRLMFSSENEKKTVN